MEATYAGSGLHETLTVRPLPGKGAVTVHRRLRNPTGRPVDLQAVIEGGDTRLLVPTAGEYDPALFGSLRNVRLERLPHSRPDFPYVRELPAEPTTFGDTEDQPLPFIFWTNSRLRDLLYEASLEETVFQRRWTIAARTIVGMASDSIARVYEICHDDPQSRPRRIEPGAAFTAGHVFYQIRRDADLNTIHDDVLQTLAARIPFRGPRSPLRREAVFCTWNYGVMRDIDEVSLLQRARFIAEHFPSMPFFQIDDGYQRADGGLSYDIGQWYPDPRDNYHRERFPSGMKAMADAIRRIGLKPILWWTPAAAAESPLRDAHPEWFARDSQGKRWSITGKTAVLDFGRQDVREFIERVLDVVFGEWGYMGTKLDFWSNAFATRDVRLSCHPLEARAWLLEAVRRRIPGDGFLEVCCSTAMGAPELGAWADTYRVGVDIGHGAWHQHLWASNWTFPLLCLDSRRALLLNMDSLGINPDLSDDENLSRLTWCFITQGILEVGGRLERLSEKHLGWLTRVLANPDRGYKVWCPERDAFTGEPFPRVLVVHYPDDSPSRRRGIRSHLALFNWHDAEEAIAVPLARCGLPTGARLTDFWTGAQAAYGDGLIVERLRPHASRLLEAHA